MITIYYNVSEQLVESVAGQVPCITGGNHLAVPTECINDMTEHTRAELSHYASTQHD